MTNPAQSLPGLLAAVPLVLLALTACGAGDSDENYVVQGSIRLGEVWDGPEQKLYSQGNEELIIRRSTTSTTT